jgi:hypothetical protein
MTVAARAAIFGVMLVSVGACDAATASRARQPTANPVVPAARALNMPRVAADCSITLPQGYVGGVSLPQQASPHAPTHPNVLAWSSGAWGMIEASWRIERGGNGCFIENENQIAENKLAPRYHRFSVSEREFDEIATMLDFPRLKSQMTNCQSFMSDAVRGSYDWYGQGRMSWVIYDTGEKCSGSDAFYQTMNAVTARVKAKITP